MAAADLSHASPGIWWLAPQRRWQLGTLIVLIAIWEALSVSGLFYRGVIPPTPTIGASLIRMLADLSFWLNLSVTLTEIGLAIVFGGGMGVVVGLLLGSNRFLGAAFGPYVIYLASTPKVILLPIIYLVFGIGPASKVVVGAIACFMPMAISTASGVRHLNPVLTRVGRSFRLSPGQMVRKIYLPGMVAPIANGLRIALGSAIGVCLIAEIKFSNAGIGHMVIDNYNRSRFPDVYAALVGIVTLALIGNALIDRLIWRWGKASPA
jgi:ABC-type nitrate/sulfonate/bicarbonate transport system permease component